MNTPVRKYGKKMSISIFVVIYAFLAFVQVTYAWIALSNENTWDNAELGVIAESELYFSLDGVVYKNTLTSEDLKPYIGYRSKIQDATTTDGRTFYGTYDHNSLAVANVNYLSFTMRVRTSAPIYENLFLVENVTTEYTYDEVLEKNVSGTFALSKGVSWTSNIDFSNGEEDIKKGSIGTYYAANALRIAVVEEVLDERFGVTDKENLLSLIFDPSEDEERGFGKTYGALDYLNKLKKLNITPPTVFPDTKYSLSDFINPYQAVDDTSMVASFQKVVLEGQPTWYYTKITVSIWIEGWDADCFDAICADELIVQLKFRAASLA